MTNYNRTFEEALELIWIPAWGLCPDLYEKRTAAILEVARRLPNEIVETLEAKADSFHWFIPKPRILAGVYPFPITFKGTKEEEKSSEFGIVGRFSKVLYLSPNLEKTSFAIAVASVAHELAHIVLNHPTAGVPKPRIYWAAEKAAWKLVDSWGFSREAKKHAQLYKRREKND